MIYFNVPLFKEASVLNIRPYISTSIIKVCSTSCHTNAFFMVLHMVRSKYSKKVARRKKEDEKEL